MEWKFREALNDEKILKSFIIAFLLRVIIIIINDTFLIEITASPCPLEAALMTDQPSGEILQPRDYGGILGDSEDSGEAWAHVCQMRYAEIVKDLFPCFSDVCPEDVLESSWDALPPLERLGLSSTKMTEQEVEDSFAQLALAFRCDQYTLKRRLQAEEHDCCVAEENVHLELQRTKDTLQSLKVRCQDRERKEILEKLELSLENIGGTVQGIITAAEVLGTVHQEARVTHAVELMVSHVESLNRRHAAESAELEETRRLVHRTRGRMYSDTTDDGDHRHCLIRQPSQQYLTRRRVSMTLIPTMAQISDLESKIPDSNAANGDSDSVGSVRSTGPPVSSKDTSSLKTCNPESTGKDPPAHQQERLTNCTEEEDPADTLYNRSSLQDTLCRWRKSVAAKEEEEEEEEEEVQGSDTESEHHSTSLSEQRPLVTWLPHCTCKERQSVALDCVQI
ncbi:hypothetical protein GJAV_G00178970 [Gymnothorax javanicus]|nr:hypothetical protein GJAV_G00178970 [Gymnothorax javanicus]